MMALVLLAILFFVFPVLFDWQWVAGRAQRRRHREHTTKCCDSIKMSPHTGFFRSACPGKATVFIYGHHWCGDLHCEPAGRPVPGP